MPKAKNPSNGPLDTWGRRNRKLPDYVCEECGATFKPYRASSRYCSRRCAWNNNGKHNVLRRKDYWWKDSRGYIQGAVWDGNQKRRVRQHRWIMEQHLGRTLLSGEDVHHINGVIDDNRLENLRLILHGPHSQHHNHGREYKHGYKLNLTAEQRSARSRRMSEMRRSGRM